MMMRPLIPAYQALFSSRALSIFQAPAAQARIDADRKLECVLTLRAGRIVYERDGHALPHRRDAPEPYWRLPELQTGAIERNWRRRP